MGKALINSYIIMTDTVLKPVGILTSSTCVDMSSTMPAEWGKLNYGLTPIIFSAMGLIGFLWHILILTPAEPGWLKGGVKAVAPFANLNFNSFLNASRLSDLIATLLVFMPTMIVGALTMIESTEINWFFMVWVEIMFFVNFVLPWIAPAIMTYSF